MYSFKVYLHLFSLLQKAFVDALVLLYGALNSITMLFDYKWLFYATIKVILNKSNIVQHLAFYINSKRFCWNLHKN